MFDPKVKEVGQPENSDAFILTSVHLAMDSDMY